MNEVKKLSTATTITTTANITCRFSADGTSATQSTRKLTLLWQKSIVFVTRMAETSKSVTERIGPLVCTTCETTKIKISNKPVPYVCQAGGYFLLRLSAYTTETFYFVRYIFFKIKVFISELKPINSWDQNTNELFFYQEAVFLFKGHHRLYPLASWDR